MITGAAAYGVELYCTQLGGRVRTVSQLPVTTSSSAVMETSSLEVFKQTHVRGTLVGVHTREALQLQACGAAAGSVKAVRFSSSN
jgi:hypothetical protein